MLEHDSSCQVSIDNGSTDNIHVLIVLYGLRVEIKESKKKLGLFTRLYKDARSAKHKI